MKILVTGSAGFIGSHFADYVLQQGDSVVGVDDLSFGKRANVNPDAGFIKADVTDFDQMEGIVLSEQPAAIVHFAANATTKSSAMGWSHPTHDYRINMVGTLNLLEIIRKHKLDVRFVYASSAAVYGEPEYVPVDEKHPKHPQAPYGVSKLAGENYCYAYGKEWAVQTTTFRIFNTFGPRQSRYIMYDQIKKILASDGEIEVIGTGEQVRDYVYVTDVAKAFYLGMTHPEAVGQTFNLAGGNQISVKDLVNLIKSLLGKDVTLRFTGQSWKGDITRLSADTGYLRKTLGWAPETSLEDGLRSLIAWLGS